MTNRRALIPLTGYVEDRLASDGKTSVEGTAFEIPGYEFMRLWVTPFIFYDRSKDGIWLTVSQWDTGKRLNVMENTEDAAIAAAEKIVKEKGVKKCRDTIKHWLRPNSYTHQREEQ